MKSFIKTFDDLPFILKVIFALPGLDFLWGIYRLLKGIDKKNTVLIIVGAIWILAGAAILWIIDLITIILNKKPTILVD
ncbi:MAG TPA: hypothetical protein PK340_04445 [Bacilli bacterium]|jgi:hypothetical protein|nr:hypothetical protein [Bacilli bacterium]